MGVNDGSSRAHVGVIVWLYRILELVKQLFHHNLWVHYLSNCTQRNCKIQNDDSKHS